MSEVGITDITKSNTRINGIAKSEVSIIHFTILEATNQERPTPTAPNIKTAPSKREHTTTEITPQPRAHPPTAPQLKSAPTKQKQNHHQENTPAPQPRAPQLQPTTPGEVYISILFVLRTVEVKHVHTRAKLRGLNFRHPSP